MKRAIHTIYYIIYIYRNRDNNNNINRYMIGIYIFLTQEMRYYCPLFRISWRCIYIRIGVAQQAGSNLIQRMLYSANTIISSVFVGFPRVLFVLSLLLKCIYNLSTEYKRQSRNRSPALYLYSAIYPIELLLLLLLLLLLHREI